MPARANLPQKHRPVISKDITKIPIDEIPTAKVDYTIVGGKIAYSRAAN